MATGDGWAVKRYKCPECFRKGLYLKYHIIGHHGFGCMYKDCVSNLEHFVRIDYEKILEANPILKTEKAKYKP